METIKPWVKNICWVVLCAAVWTPAFCLYAGDFERLGHDGMEGREILTIASGVLAGSVVWAGTERGVFRRDLSRDESWQKVDWDDNADTRVRQIVFCDYASSGYAATSKGVYEIDPEAAAARKIYSSGQDAEQDCFSVTVDAGGHLYAATRAGLYVRALGARRWDKCVTDLGDKAVDYVYAAGSIVYAALADGLYRSQDGARTWSRVFYISESAAIPQGEEEEAVLEETDVNRIHSITAQKGAPSTLYLSTSQGIFKSDDAGMTWNLLALQGIGIKNVLDCVVSPGTGDLYAVTKTGVFEWVQEGWRLLAPLYDGRRMALSAGRLLTAAPSGIYAFRMSQQGPAAGGRRKLSLDPACEPTIQDVQEMVIKYCDVSNEKIDLWHKQSRAKAFLPDLSFGYGNNVYGTYNGLFAVGPNDWQVNVSWDLADLVYSTDQTSIDNRSRLMVQLRNDVLAEATQLYFERKRLVAELNGQNDMSSEYAKKNIRVEELTALLDRLTGGSFTKDLKRSL